MFLQQKGIVFVILALSYLHLPFSFMLWTKSNCFVSVWLYGNFCIHILVCLCFYIENKIFLCITVYLEPLFSEANFENIVSFSVNTIFTVFENVLQLHCKKEKKIGFTDHVFFQGGFLEIQITDFLLHNASVDVSRVVLVVLIDHRSCFGLPKWPPALYSRSETKRILAWIWKYLLCSLVIRVLCKNAKFAEKVKRKIFPKCRIRLHTIGR